MACGNLKMALKACTVPDRESTLSPNGIKCLSFFSGALGLDLGLEAAGIHPLLACDTDRRCRETIVANRPDIGLIGDCRDYTADEIMRKAGLRPGDDVDLMVGGPPCQAFSTAGKRRGFRDERGNVILRYIDLILEIRPRFAVIENVRGILSAPLEHIPWKDRPHRTLGTRNMKGGALSHIIARLRGAGYGVTFNLYNAANFGAPEVRERVIFICARSGAAAPYLVPTHSEDGQYGLPRWRTLRDAIGDLRESDQRHLSFPEKRLRWYRMLKEGQNWRDLPVKFQKEALGKSYEAGGGKTGFLRRLAWDKPSPTLVTSPAMPATDLAHPEKDRPLSIQEYKRIQEFPDDWILCGSLADQYRQVGNAVPVSLGRAVGNLILSMLHDLPVKEYKEFKYSRYAGTTDRHMAPLSPGAQLPLFRSAV